MSRSCWFFSYDVLGGLSWRLKHVQGLLSRTQKQVVRPWVDFYQIDSETTPQSLPWRTPFAHGSLDVRASGLGSACKKSRLAFHLRSTLLHQRRPSWTAFGLAECPKSFNSQIIAANSVCLSWSLSLPAVWCHSTTDCLKEAAAGKLSCHMTIASCSVEDLTLGLTSQFSALCQDRIQRIWSAGPMILFEACLNANLFLPIKQLPPS